MPGAVHASGAKSSEARTSKPWVCSEVRTDVWVPLGKSLYLSRLCLLFNWLHFQGSGGRPQQFQTPPCGSKVAAIALASLVLSQGSARRFFKGDGWKIF